MYVKQCPECGKIFQSGGNVGLCEACTEREHAEMEKVLEFLQSMKGKAALEEIVQQTEIPQPKVMKIVQRINLAGEYQVTWPCKRCNAEIPVLSGQLCSGCAREMHGLFQKTDPQKKSPEVKMSGSRMYSLGKER